MARFLTFLLLFVVVLPTAVLADGACCDDSGVCTIVVDEAACEVLTNGVNTVATTSYYEGDATVCSPNPCEATFIAPITPTFIETYVFRNGYQRDGVTPGSYDGIRLIQINDVNPDTNYESDPEVLIGNDDDAGMYRALFSVDLSELPDSFMTWTAELFFLRGDLSTAPTIGSAWGAADQSSLEFYRIFKQWDPSEVTWNSASTGTAWDVPGLGNLSIAVGKWAMFGSPGSEPVRTTGQSVLSPQWTTGGVTSVYSINGHHVSVGADTLRWQAAEVPAEIMLSPEYIMPFRGRHYTGYSTAGVWAHYRIDQLVTFMIRNPDQNLGYLLAFDQLTLDDLRGCEIVGTAAADPMDAPFVVITGAMGVPDTEAVGGTGGGGSRSAGIKIF